MTGSSFKRIQVSVFSFLQYEKLTDMIVPRSSQLIYQVTRMLLFVLTIFTQDNDHALVSVTLFQKVVDEFKTKVGVLSL